MYVSVNDYSDALKCDIDVDFHSSFEYPLTEINYLVFFPNSFFRKYLPS